MQPDKPKRPPAYQIAIALFSVAVFFSCAALVANQVDYLHGIYVKPVWACLSPVALLMAMYYPFKSMDDHRRDNPDDENP